MRWNFRCIQCPYVRRLVQLIGRGEVVEVAAYADYLRYNISMYEFLEADMIRMNAFEGAISNCVRGKTVLDVGTGANALLARLAAKYGADRVVAVESDRAAAEAAKKLVNREELSRKISIVHGFAEDLSFTERNDVCIAELIGSIAGSEGASRILGRMAENGTIDSRTRMIPEAAESMFAPALRPKGIVDAKIEEGKARVLAMILRGRRGNPRFRRLFYNFPKDALLSAEKTLEKVDFLIPNSHKKRKVSFSVVRDGIFQGFAVWNSIVVAKGYSISTFGETHWGTVFLSLDGPPISVRKNDGIDVVIAINPSEDRLSQDYRITGNVSRRGVILEGFSVTSIHGGIEGANICR